MNKERKSKLIRSYIEEEDDDSEDYDLLDDYYYTIKPKDDNNNTDNDNNKIDNKIENRLSDPLITNERRNSNNSNRSSKPKFTGENAEEKQMLYDMGFKSQLINTIYNNIHPIDLQEALDYLNKNDKGKFTHSYIENERFVCSICNQGRYAHENTALFVDNANTGTNTGTNNGNNNDSLALNIISNNNNNNNTTTRTNNRLSSDRYNILESSYLNSKNKSNYDYTYSKPKECGICGDKIENEDSFKIKINCGHVFCVDCWDNYLQEKINNANVAKISCMQHGCSVLLSKEFIKRILNNDEILIKKYEKFLEKQNLLMSNKKIKFCPIPDCDGYAEKKDDKYVKCNFGHDFCFECLKQPHGKKKCEEIIDEDFEEWKKHKIVKRCPNCKMWTEKNEGCNHMTCVECKFQWCWLCQKKYSYNHYSVGSCKGLQFEKEQDEEKIRKMLEANLKKYPPPKPPKCQCLRNAIKEFLLFLLFIFLSPYFFFFRLADRSYAIDNDFLFYLYLFSVVPTFICFEIFFFSFNLIMFIPGLLLSRKYRDLFHFVREPFEY